MKVTIIIYIYIYIYNRRKKRNSLTEIAKNVTGTEAQEN